MDDTPLVCCICQSPVGEDAPRLGGRIYCAAHYAKLASARTGAWTSGAILILGLIVFTVLMELLLAATKPALEGTSLVLVGIVLALVPALLWLAFFYLQDRLEPEPKRLVGSVFVLGALLALAVGMPVLRDLFRVQEWIGKSWVANLLGSILVIGMVQEFLKYAAIRYSVYPMAEFDERTDGIIYGSAAGLGYATMLNIQYVVANGGVALDIGIVRIVVTALAQAAFAGITGYFLGQAKFEDEPIWWLPLGLGIAAGLNGVFTVLRGELSRGGLSLSGARMHPWVGLILASILAIATLIALTGLIRRATRSTLAREQST
jgi:RsiW-degrading membrane proteinase PrsW (M82 family)